MNDGVFDLGQEEIEMHIRKGEIKMGTTIKRIGRTAIRVIANDDLSVNHEGISRNDAEMDKRAIAAVQSAINKARVCKKPVARYDVVTKRALVEYADGRIDYVD